MTLSVVILSETNGFPHGMAGTQRIRMIAQALAESGNKVTVLCIRVTEFPPLIKNDQPAGNYNGISFEYTTGTTIRSSSFVGRRVVEIRGILVAIFRLIQLKLQGKVDCLYSYMGIHRFGYLQLLFRILAKVLQVPVVVDLCERPWSLETKQSFLSRRLSPLVGVKGIVTISNFLSDWVIQEERKLSKKFHLQEIPILVDMKEKRPVLPLYDDPAVLFAGAAGYDQTITFILDSMDFVWIHYPKCKLIITGFSDKSLAQTELAKRIHDGCSLGRVELAGYLSRPQLFEHYQRAWALLIPLFNDVRSKARFPTKIGEYLSSGRPIVTTSIGEINRFFIDGENAFVSRPDDSMLYGRKIIEIIKNPEKATQIGLAGRGLAENKFHYSIYSESLSRFIRDIVNTNSKKD